LFSFAAFVKLGLGRTPYGFFAKIREVSGSSFDSAPTGVFFSDSSHVLPSSKREEIFHSPAEKWWELNLLLTVSKENTGYILASQQGF
jgi:hypothetical protein